MKDGTAWVLTAAAIALLFAIARSAVKSLLSDRWTISWRRTIGGHGIRLSTEADTARMGTWLSEFPSSFWFPRGQRVTEPRDMTMPWATWAHRQAGIDVGTTVVEVTIQATAERAIAVDAPKISSTNVGRPPGYIREPQGLGGGSIQPHIYFFDLDNPVQPARYKGPSSDSDVTLSFRMSPGDTERIYIVAVARKDLHRWKASIPVIVDGRKLHLDVAPRSGLRRRPVEFQTIGAEGYETIYWLMSGNGWSSNKF